jgi:DnaJ-class molecular chaperone
VSERDVYEVLQVQPTAHQLVVQAAFRVLASMYHPDRDPTGMATRKMAELNAAYAKVKTRDLRDAYDRARKARQTVAVSVGTTTTQDPDRTARRTAQDAGMVDFGRYAGWTISQLARHDPDYLRWLSRHSSGIRYRRQIEAALGQPTAATPSERMRGR